MRYRVIYFQCLCHLSLSLCIVSMHLTRCVSFFSLFNFLFLKLQFMRIKMYTLAVFAQYTACPSHHLTLVVSACSMQLLKSGTLSLHLSVPVLVLIPFVVTSRPTTASRPSNPLNPSLLAPQIRLLLTIIVISSFLFVQ